MQTVLYLEINGICIAVMALLFFNIYRPAERLLFDQKLFLTLLAANTLVLLFDSGMWFIDGRTEPISYFLNVLVSTTYYILSPMICMVWYFFVEYQVYKSETRFRRYLFLKAFPFLFVVALCVLNLENGLLFYVDDNNVYHRSTFFFLYFSITYFYLAWSFLLVFLKKKDVRKENFLPLLLFSLPPTIGGIIQSMHYGVSLIWAGSTLSILMVFINMQNHELYTDYLTGLFNRKRLDMFLLEQAQKNKKNGFLAGIMMDLDSFKQINDRFGHDAGDEALKETARLLTASFRKDDFLARYGGDEFVVIMDVESEKEVAEALQKLDAHISAFNRKGSTPYELHLTYGFDLVPWSSQISSGEFLQRLDHLMYANKKTRQT